jgi:hypothetical protein
MELKNAASGTAQYSGPGQIRQTVEGTLGYTLYDTQAEEGFAWGNLPRPGSWIEDSDLFDLELRDWQGRLWRANRTRSYTSNVIGEKGVVCRGDLREIVLTSESYRSSGESIWLFFPVAMEIPYNRMTSVEQNAAGRRSFRLDPNIWLIDSGEFRLRITKAEDGVEVEATRSDGRFPEHFDTRLTEALWFVFARPIEWQICIRTDVDNEILTLRRRPQPPVEPRLYPPREFDDPDAAADAGDMLLKYLQYIGDFNEPRFHPTSVNVRQTLLASATNIETEALALGVAFESFVRREFKQLGVPENAVIRGIDAALDFWESWTGDSSLKERIKGAVSGIKGSNPRESINKLVNQGVLAEEHRDAWNKLRHTTAHGMDFTADFRKIVHWCNLAHMGFLRLIFSRIEYTGVYTDRTVEGWPTVEVQAQPNPAP